MHGKLPRFVVRFVSFAIALSCAEIGRAAEPNVAIYSPSFLGTHEVEKALKDDPVLKNYRCSVFTRFSDFLQTQEKEPAAIVIAPASYVTFYQGYIAHQQLSRGGKSEFQFLLLALRPKWDKASIEKGTLGIVDELGQKFTKPFVDKLVGGKGFKRIKRVMKVEDLMTLLAVDDADYIYIRPEDYEKVKAQFNLPVVRIGESEPTGNPVIAVKDTDKSTDMKSFAKLSKQALNALGFDGIQAVGGSRQ